MGLFKSKASAKPPATKRGESRPTSYRGVEIRCAEEACDAAKAERGKRYLSKDAPNLPLSQCDRRERCDCRYRHHEDRRAKEDRRGASPTIAKHVETERRSKVGRRAEDSLDDPTVTEAQVPKDPLDDTYYGYRRR